MGILTTNVAAVKEVTEDLVYKAILSDTEKEVVIVNFVFSDTAPADTSKIWGYTCI